jgi:membrane protein
MMAAANRFLDHHLIDWSAGLTFYAAISLIPALVITFGIIGLLGDSTLDAISSNLQKEDAGPVRELALDAVDELRTNHFSAGVALLIGIGGALWSASSYVGSFLRASGVIHDRDGRYPFWKLRPLQIAITAGVIVAIAGVALAVVVTGPLAESVARLVGLEEVAAEVWDIGKWPVIVVIVMTIFAVLYWAGPDTRARGFRWITPGGVVATGAWALGSGAYALYVAAFPDYNQVYGSLGAIVGFLAWLWASNMAMLYGAELNAVLERLQDADADAGAGGAPRAAGTAA